MAGSSDHQSSDMRTKLEFPVWYRSFSKSYVAWANAPSDLKTPLLLQGPALAKAEDWLLVAPDKLSESEKRFIVRSISLRARGAGDTPSAPGAASKKRWQWRRSSDRSFWQLYAVLALGLWFFAPDIIRDVMEQSLNAPEVFSDQRAPQRKATPPPHVADAQPEPAAAPVEQTVAPGDDTVAPSSDEPTPAAAPAPVVAPPAPPVSRAVRLVDLTQQLITAGRGRDALLIGIEAGELALADGEAGAKEAAAATALLARAMATREQLEPLAPRSVTQATALFCDDARALLTVSGDNAISIWPAGSRRAARLVLPLESLDGAGLDRDCRRALLPNADFNIEVRSLAGGRAGPDLHGHEATITAASFSPDGTAIVTASKDGTARIWDARSGRMRHLLSGHDWHVVAAEFSRDGRRVLTAASDMTARIWDAASGREVARLGHQGVVTSARFSADGSRIVTTAWDGFVRLWDAASGSLLQTYSLPGGLVSAELSRDGRWLATAAGDGGLQLWDAVTGEARHALPDASSRQMLFTPDSSRLIVLSWTEGVSVIDVANGARVGRPADSEQNVVAIKLGTGGRSLVAITAAGTRSSWPLPASAEEAIAQAKAIAPACLTADERRIHGLDGEQPAWCASIRARGAAIPRAPAMPLD